MDRIFRSISPHDLSRSRVRSLSCDMSPSRIRKLFMDYFCKNQKHLYVQSSPVFSLRDPSLAFVNAGMNQFKDVFLGHSKPASARVANYQKCIRIGGKHNDLQQVGQDGTHHTFFEMLGNWSFGDYFKREACTMSWDLLTNIYGLPAERLYVTYFAGNETLGLDPDLEVKETWREIGIKEDRILPFGIKDNFWEMGTTGPCGPSTEIHYDHRPDGTNRGLLVNAGGPEVTELWNLVFIQYNRNENGTLEKLEKNFVDTGMGFERLVAILQGKTSNYDTDLFFPLFEAISRHTNHSGYKGTYDGNLVDTGYRTLADHSRMITVALADGMIPNHQNKVRKIFRKALSVAEKVFDSDSALLKELTNHVAEILSDAYPQIGSSLPKIHYILKCEEDLVKSQKKASGARWTKILKSYPELKHLDIQETPQLIEGVEYVEKNVLKFGRTAISDQDAWYLYDTLGVPAHTTEMVARGLNLGFSMSSFEHYEQILKKSLKKAQEAKMAKQFDDVIFPEALEKLKKAGVQQTDDSFKHDYRLGGDGNYIFREQQSTVTGIVAGGRLKDFITAEDVKDGQEVGLILDRTQLFSQDTNQQSDEGSFLIENQFLFDIRKVVRIKGYAVHLGNFPEFPSDGRVNVHNVGVVELNKDRRVRIMRNHTALHIVNGVLCKMMSVGGEKFSKVTPENFSIDYMYYEERPNFEDIKSIESAVRDIIRLEGNVDRKAFSHSMFQQSDDIIFYPGDAIVEREIPVVEISAGYYFFREYCNGTHVLNVSDLKDFAIVSHTASGSHLKRLQGVTGEEATKFREATTKTETKWRLLRHDSASLDDSDVSKVLEIGLKLKEFYKEVNASTDLPPFVKENLSKEVKVLLNDLQNNSLRRAFEKKIEKEVENSKENFVVLEMNEIPGLQNLPRDMKTPRKPVIVFYVSGNSVSVHSLVPKEYLSETFTASKWAQHSLMFLGGVGQSLYKKGDVTYLVKERKMNEKEITEALKKADRFARNNIRG